MTAALTRLALFALTALATFGASANPAHDAVAKMSESARNTAFTEYMSRNSRPCKVERTFFQGFTDQKDAVWSIACANKESFAIMLRNDAEGSSRYVECDRLKAGSKRECFKKY